MSSITTPAILIRRLEYGESDLILTFLTRYGTKITVMAKAAKKSVKRFGGILELFYLLEIVYPERTKKGLPVLAEASLIQPFISIRTDIFKTAYAGYWVQLIYEWVEEGNREESVSVGSGEAEKQLFDLLQYVLTKLDENKEAPGVLSVLFQMRFLSISGLCPSLSCCSNCECGLDETGPSLIHYDLKSGGLLCECCAAKTYSRSGLTKGTVKLLKWIESLDLEKAERIKFSGQAVHEAEDFLEAFIPYHMGKTPKSLKFLKKIRK